VSARPPHGTAGKASPRLGPRPLPLHLLSAMASWFSCAAAWPISKSGWPLSKPDRGDAWRALAGPLAAVAPEEFGQALDRELRREADAFLRGLERYRHFPQRRTADEVPSVWNEGTTRLLDYGPPEGIPVLFVPSLINRYYILDLGPERGLLRFLAAHGLRPLVVDWGKPGTVERGFTLTDYVAGRLEAALDAALELAGRPLGVVGYCMGGNLALALAQRRRRDIAALALLATPWDFHVDQEPQARVLASLADLLASLCAPLGEVPVDILQSLFAALDPLLALRKFVRFAALDPESREARDFVALEDWLNDGVPLALPTAREALTDWYGANAPAAGSWRVAGRAIRPQRLELPSLVVLPGLDRIVPPRSAAALAEALPGAARLAPAMGHIGMIVGGGAEMAVWRPLLEWLRQWAAAPPQRQSRAGRRERL
jgi:polyhydroxyalkanoate synthase subunit PhaC